MGLVLLPDMEKAHVSLAFYEPGSQSSGMAYGIEFILFITLVGFVISSTRDFFDRPVALLSDLVHEYESRRCAELEANVKNLRDAADFLKTRGPAISWHEIEGGAESEALHEFGEGCSGNVGFDTVGQRKFAIHHEMNLALCDMVPNWVVRYE